MVPAIGKVPKSLQRPALQVIDEAACQRIAHQEAHEGEEPDPPAFGRLDSKQHACQREFDKRHRPDVELVDEYAATCVEGHAICRDILHMSAKGMGSNIDYIDYVIADGTALRRTC
jgi:hypothetical protein